MLDPGGLQGIQRIGNIFIRSFAIAAHDKYGVGITGNLCFYFFIEVFCRLRILLIKDYLRSM